MLLTSAVKYPKAHALKLEVIRGALPVSGGYDLEAYYRSHLEENSQRMAGAHVLGVFDYD